MVKTLGLKKMLTIFLREGRNVKKRKELQKLSTDKVRHSWPCT
jgi:hypothetical protein